MSPVPGTTTATTAKPPMRSAWSPGATTPAASSAAPGEEEKSGGSGKPTGRVEGVHERRHQPQARAEAARSVRTCARRRQHRAGRPPHEMGQSVPDRPRPECPAGGRALPRPSLAAHPRRRGLAGRSRRARRLLAGVLVRREPRMSRRGARARGRLGIGRRARRQAQCRERADNGGASNRALSPSERTAPDESRVSTATASTCRRHLQGRGHSRCRAATVISWCISTKTGAAGNASTERSPAPRDGDRALGSTRTRCMPERSERHARVFQKRQRIGLSGGVWAMPSARALRSYLHSLALAPKPLRSLSPPLAARRCALRLARTAGRSGESLRRAVPRGEADGVRCRWRELRHPAVLSNCVTRARGPSTPPEAGSSAKAPARGSSARRRPGATVAQAQPPLRPASERRPKLR